MRITKRDLKHGTIRLVPEDADDLWDLRSVLDPGDRVRASTERKMHLGGSEEKSKVVKKRMTLTLSLEKIQYETHELRLLGNIVDGPEDAPRGSAHSFGITPGTELTVQKDWPRYQLSRLEEATKERNAVLAVLFDREHALFLSVTGRGVETLTKLKGDVGKKGLDDPGKGGFYDEIIKTADEYNTRLKPAGVVFASPAFWQEYVKGSLPSSLQKKAAFTSISDVERTAVKELVKRPELQKLLKNNRAALELGYAEEMMNALAHDKLAYGKEDVREAVDLANVKAVFLSEKTIQHEREEEQFHKTEKLLRDAEAAGAGVHIIGSGEAREKLDGLGGIAAVKRW